MAEKRLNIDLIEDLFVREELLRLYEENEQLQEERGYFERKKCEYFNKYNKKHLENIQLKEENEELRKENEKLESLWEDKCIKEYMTFLGENALQEMHNEKYRDK